MTTAATVDLQNSTIVRFNKSGTYQAIAATFGFAERYAPAFGGRIAERLWFRIPRARVRRPGWLPEGRRTDLNVNGRRVAAESWGSGPRVYLVHGWGGAGAQLAMFVPLLLESGYSVVSFDALGHGASDHGPMGRGQGSILDFVESLKAAIANFGPPHAIIAHSFGSTATAKALREGVHAERLVFIAPMADPERYMDGFVQLLGGGERVRAALHRRIEQRVGFGVETLQVATQPHEHTRPLLVFHDRDDRETAWRDGADIARAWPQARLVTTAKLGHRRILTSPAVVREAVRFIREAGATQKTLGASERSTPRAKAARRLPRWAVGRAMHFALVLALVGLAGAAQAQAPAERPHPIPPPLAGEGERAGHLALQFPERADAAALQIEPPSEIVLRREVLQEARKQRERLRGLAPLHVMPGF